MSQIVQKITLTSQHHYGRKLPPHEFGYFLVELPVAVRFAVSMALRGRSTARGPRPHWLSAASDIRFIDHAGDDQSELYFEVLQLGEAAQEIYQQGELWPTRPDSIDTGFDLLGDVLKDVGSQNEDSDRYDPPLLRRLMSFRKVLDDAFEEVLVTGHRHTEQPGRLTAQTVEIAERFYSNTPTPRRVRVVGMLDMIRASTQSFALRLDDGQEVRGTIPADQVNGLGALFRQRVLVLGKAVFRASGRLLRIDAEAVTPAGTESSIWSKMPQPGSGKLNVSDMRQPQGSRSGVAAIIGKWPGEESDEEVNEALESLS